MMHEMVQVNDVLANCTPVECKGDAECLRKVALEETNDAYWVEETRVPIPDLPQEDRTWFPEGNWRRVAFHTFKDTTNRPYVTFELQHPVYPSGDMSDTFTCNAECTFYIGSGDGIENATGRAIWVCMAFSRAWVRIYLDQPNLPKELCLSQRYHLFSTKVRHELAEPSLNGDGLRDGNLLYVSGMIGQIN